MCRDPADLLHLNGEAATRLLRAAGVDEAVMETGANYDRFLAFASVLPLCRGHLGAEAGVAALQEATGATCPLTRENAPLYWQRWVEIHWYGLPSPVEIPSDGGATAPPCRARDVSMGEVCVLPDPLALCREEALPDLALLRSRLMALLPTTPLPVLLCLPADYVFSRPDPYHAERALEAVRTGCDTSADRDLLLTQILRLAGEILRGRQEVTLYLYGGRRTAVVRLLAYLSASDRLPATVWFPKADATADVAYVSGLYREVGTGYVLSQGDPPDVRAAREAAYAAVAPLGKGIVLTDLER